MTMNLLYPFKSARGLEPDAFGRIALVDEGDKVLALVPLATAHELSSEQECDLPEWCFVDGSGDGLGSGHDSGYGFDCGGGSGQGYGVVYGYGYGNGEGCGEE